jgi:hypothetical protein
MEYFNFNSKKAKPITARDLKNIMKNMELFTQVPI